MNAAQAKALRAPFPANQIGKLPKAGTKLDYVGHAAVTARLLEVDPDFEFGPVMNANHVPIVRPGGRSGAEVLYALTVLGVTRHEWGDGPNMKECSSDAIRRCAMRFGVALDLWAKEDLQATREEVSERLDPAAGADQVDGNPSSASAADTPAPLLASTAQIARLRSRIGELRRMQPDHDYIQQWDALGSDGQKALPSSDAKSMISQTQDAITAIKLANPELPVTA